MRLLVTGIVAAVLAAPSVAAAPPLADLQISFWPKGIGGKHYAYSVRCGGVSRTGTACKRFRALMWPFAPVPGETACTEIYGGPQTALVRGTFRGRRVWARFSRTDGCQIARWDRLSFLFVPLGRLRP